MRSRVSFGWCVVCAVQCAISRVSLRLQPCSQKETYREAASALHPPPLFLVAFDCARRFCWNHVSLNPNMVNATPVKNQRGAETLL